MAKFRKQYTSFHYGANPATFEQANIQRKNLTDAQKILWVNLRNRKLMGYKFRRQHPVGMYIVGFYCPDKLLVNKIEDKIHYNPDNKERDEGRENALKNFGFSIIRFNPDYS